MEDKSSLTMEHIIHLKYRKFQMDYLDRSILFKKIANYTAEGCPKRLLDYTEYDKNI